MTGQSLLDRMELVNAELQLQAGETDVTRGLLALNVAQDYFESLLALRGKAFGSSHGSVTTTGNTETTSFPLGCLRIDRIQLIDDATNRPKRDLEPIRKAGGHAVNQYWPYNVTSPTTSGEPRMYETTGTLIYWSPLPDAVYNLRIVGFYSASDITASGTFAYPDVVAFPLAVFACQVIKTGLDDDASALSGLATQSFGTVLDQMALGNRDGAVGLEYTELHTS